MSGGWLLVIAAVAFPVSVRLLLELDEYLYRIWQRRNEQGDWQ